MMSGCRERCSGCAFTPKALAYEEVNNRLLAILTALAGEPFQCHERLGWTPDKEGYPGGKKAIERAMSALMVAPTLIHNCEAVNIGPEFFAQERAVIGRQPICEGWRGATAKIAALGWFKNHEEGRSAAKQAMHTLQLLLAAESKSDERKELLAEFRVDFMALVEFVKQAGLQGIILRNKRGEI